jgi:hypothetical protein
MEPLGSHWTGFNEIWYLFIFWNCVEKIQFSSTSDKNNGYFPWTAIYIFDHISLSSSWNEKYFRQICRGNQTTHFVCKNVFSKIYKIMWKKIVEPDKPQLTIWRMRIACCIPKATNAHSEYVILIAFPLQQWLHKHASSLRYTYFVLFVISYFV